MALSSLQLEAFFSVATMLNFSRAAETLHITQSALSQRILNLEDDLEITLFIRDRSGVRLTEEGYRLLRFCQMKNTLEDEMLEDIRKRGSPNQIAGTLRIAGFSSVVRSLVLPSLAPLLQDHPNIGISLLSREVSELPHLLRRGEVDFIVTCVELADADLVRHDLGYEINRLYASVDKPSGVSDIYIDHDENDKITEQFFQLQDRKIKLKRRYLDDVYGLLDGVVQGVGRAVLPEHLVAQLPKGAVKEIKGFKALRIPVILYYFERPYYSRLQSAAQKLLLEKLPARLKIKAQK